MRDLDYKKYVSSISKKSDNRLGELKKFLNAVNFEEKKFAPVIHIAGTNGKGSTVAFIKYILEAQNKKVRRYTSPHLIEYNERIEINGKKITDNELLKQLNFCKKTSEKIKVPLNFSETFTAIALIEFFKNKGDFVLLETGVGGRLDSTNIIEQPEAAIITSISIDHTKLLGNTIEKIAYEKAGIIKENCPVIISKQKPKALKVLMEIAKQKNAPMYIYGKDWSVKENSQGFIFEGFGKKLQLPKPSLLGKHQIINSSTAIAALLVQKKIKIKDESIIKGLKSTKWKARLQRIDKEKKLQNLINKNSEMYLDGGHNEDGFKIISKFIKEEKAKERKGYEKTNIILISMLAKKDVKKCLQHLKDTIDYAVGVEIVSEINSISELSLRGIFDKLSIKGITKKDFKEGLKFISKNFKQPSRIVICGSLYLAGEILSFLEE